MSRENGQDRLAKSLKTYKESFELEEFLEDFESLAAEAKGEECVGVIVGATLDCNKPAEIKLYEDLFCELAGSSKLSIEDVTAGLTLTVPVLVDIALDVPLCGKPFGRFLYLALSKDKLSVADLPKILAILVGEEEHLLLKIISSFLTNLNTEGVEKAKEIVSQINWDALVPADNLNAFLTKNPEAKALFP